MRTKSLFWTILFFCFTLSSQAANPDTSSVEWIKAFFNAPADHSYAFEGNEARDNWDLIQPLVDRIDSAKYSIDLAAYDLQNMRVGEALARAKRRGLNIRVITDINHRDHSPRYTRPMWDTLRAAGIISFDDAGTIYWPDGRIEELSQRLPNAGAHMHHKFAVIDVQSSDPDDYYLWTGTMNLTYTGPWNTNATLLIKDSGITKAYLEEFNQMWGSEGAEPNPRRARFHRDKVNVSQNKFWVGDTKVELYFGPMDRNNTKPSISERVTYLINNYARNDARFIAFAISPNIPISQALWQRSAEGDFILEGAIDPAFYGRYRNNNDIWAAPEARAGNRRILPGREVRKLHSKTMLLDASYPDTANHTAVTITGSYNFSQAAETINDENILLIYSNEITNQFYQDFMGIMNRAEGKSFHQYPEADPGEWYTRTRVDDGQILEVELAENFRYPVSLLGVSAPRRWAGHSDSTHFYADEARERLRELTRGHKVQIMGPGGGKPVHRYGRYHAYILVDTGDEIIHLNREMLRSGHGQYSRYYAQHPDSVEAFKRYADEAREAGIGMWEFEDMIGTVVQSAEAAKEEDLFPININTATQSELEFLPAVGPARAQSIIKYREDHGGFNSVDELTEIRGIGPATLERLRPLVVVDDDEKPD